MKTDSFYDCFKTSSPRTLVEYYGLSSNEDNVMSQSDSSIHPEQICNCISQIKAVANTNPVRLIKLASVALAGGSTVYFKC